MNIDQIINILKTTKLFKGMSDSLLYALAFSADVSSFSTGDVLVRSSGKEVKAIIILEGRAFLQKKSKPIELKSGSVIGMLSLINKSVIQESIIAGSTGQCLILNNELFNKLSKEFHAFPKHLLDYFQSDLNKQIDELSQVMN